MGLKAQFMGFCSASLAYCRQNDKQDTMLKVPAGSGYLPKTPDQQTKFVAIPFSQFISLSYPSAYGYRKKKCHKFAKY